MESTFKTVRKWYVKHFLLGTLMLCLCGCQTLKTGDLLFHVSDDVNAITEVTSGMIDHVAIYLGSQNVVEAVGRGVVTTPLDSLRKQKGHYVIGRVSELDVRTSTQNALRYLGRSYDWLYLPDNDAIYCSELVLLSFVDKQGHHLFAPIPMSFHDSTGQITDYWIKFYARHQMKVPEGLPGSNPSELSQRPIVHLKGRLK